MNRLDYRSFQKAYLVINHKLSKDLFRIEIKNAIESIVCYTLWWYKQSEIPSITWITDDEFVVLKWLYGIRKNSKIPQELLEYYWEYYWKWELTLLYKEIEEWISTAWQEIILRKVTNKEKREINNALIDFEEWVILLEKLEKMISKVKPIKVKKFKRYKDKWDTMFVCISDIHLWWPNHLKTLEYLQEITQYIINLEETNIVLIFPWDFVETWVCNWMHWWSQLRTLWVLWKETDMIDIVFDCLNGLFSTLLANWKSLEVFATNWNHDRDWEEHTLFWRSKTLYSIFSFLKKTYQNEYNINITYWNEPVNVIEIFWVQIILYHWDDKIDISSYWELINREQIHNLDHNKPTVSICWHYHYTDVQTLSQNKMYLRVWTLAWIWDYWKYNWYYTIDSFTTFKFNWKTFETTIHNLY